MNTRNLLYLIGFMVLVAGCGRGAAASKKTLSPTNPGLSGGQVQQSAVLELPSVTTSIDFISGQVGWAVTRTAGQEGGHIWKTRDAGLHWSEQSDWNASLSACADSAPTLSFANESDGLALCTPGGPAMNQLRKVMFRTQDGGRSWTEVADSSKDAEHLSKSGYVSDLAFVSKTTGWMSILPFVGPQVSGLHLPSLYRTHDGGGRWELQQLKAPMTLKPEDSVNQLLYFRDEIHGVVTIVFGSGQDAAHAALYLTDDGGDSWTGPIPVLGMPSALDDQSLFRGRLVFVDRNAGWFVSGSKILRTSDGGVTWSMANADIGFASVTQFSPLDVTEGWALMNTKSGESVILKTSDGGESWARVEGPDTK